MTVTMAMGGLISCKLQQRGRFRQRMGILTGLSHLDVKPRMSESPDTMGAGSQSSP
ncbi:hypothetical protein L1047_15805 [Synechococcus sp. Nb3U1]|uniref:hypothetical protein n=1 Tax=Synechococcus sp. Nb3U1 TaxID=1914529 RepID=UPI001F390115|nr:hypothetical protein [Synechococcus sp. Nb3U1]MCF2972661.1 hypothetical protein [Synechococcus sp. Nb3U1]